MWASPLQSAEDLRILAVTCRLVGVTPRHLGEVIRELRQRRGLTKADVARLAHVDESSLSRLERGLDVGKHEPQQHNLSPANKAAVAQILGVTATELDRMTADGAVPPSERPSFEEFVSADPDLTPEQVEALVLVYRQFFSRR